MTSGAPLLDGLSSCGSSQQAVSPVPASIPCADAVISPCGTYRYALSRRWDQNANPLPIIMLNPSTADATFNDPTIRRCISFAKRDGFGGIFVLNLFAFRSTSPDAMKAIGDPAGPDNDAWLIRVLRNAKDANLPVLAAWGAHGGHRGRANYVRGMAVMHGCRLVTLGTTMDGHPRHPLYVRGDQPFVTFSDSDTRPKDGDVKQAPLASSAAIARNRNNDIAQGSPND